MAEITTNFSANTHVKSAEVDQNFLDAQGGHTLGYAEVTANQTLTDNAETDLTSLSVTVTVPSGGRKIKITGYIFAVSSASSNMEADLRIYESTTLLNRVSEHLVTGTETNQGFIAMYVGTPSAGSHTYKLKFKNNISASTTIIAGATNPAFILVELI